MNSKKIFPSLLIALSALFASCSKDGSQPTTGGENLPLERISFSAELPDPATGEDGARTTLADDGHKVIWTKGSDKISVFSDNEPTRNREFTAVDAKESEAVFEGTASNTIKYSAIYPYSASNTFNKASSTFSTTLKTEQSAVLGTYADNTSIAVATLEGYNAKTNKRFKFKNATGLLKIEFSLAPALAGKEITRIELRANPDAEGVRPSISGTASVTAGTSSQRPTAKIVAEGKPYIALSNGGAAIAPTTGGKGYYMVVPTEAIGQSFSLTFIASDGTGITKKFAITTPFVSNKIKSISVNLDQLETRMLTNIPLINAIKRQGINLIAEADGTVNYFKNIDEIERARTINGQNTATPLTSLRELEYYSNLRDIRLDGVPTLVGGINIDKNSQMRNVLLRNTGITSFNIENADKLGAVTLNNNTSLTSVKVASPSIVSLNLGQNWNISSLDVTGAPALTSLSAANNKLRSVDLSQNTALTNLNIHWNELQSIDVSRNTALTDLTLSNNQLTTIDVTANTALRSLNLHGNQLQTVDVSRNTELTNLVLSNNNLAGVVDISNNAKITNLNVHGNDRLTDIAFPQGSKLTSLKASNTGITTLDLTKTKDLQSIDVGVAWGLHTINGLRDLSKLHTLQAFQTGLSSLDLSGNPLLKHLDVYNSRLLALNITQNPELLRVAANPLYAGAQTVGTITVTMTATQKAVFDVSLASDTKNRSVNVVVQ